MNTDTQTDYRVPTPCELVPHRTQEEYDRLQAHADKLAEELRRTVEFLSSGLQVGVNQPYTVRRIERARAALAAYENEAKLQAQIARMESEQTQTQQDRN
jgi:uncharacterized protein (DUF885 family)